VCYYGPWEIVIPRPGWRKQPVDSRLTDHISIGVLTRTFTKDLINQILVRCDKVQQRIRILPSRVVMYYVLALSLYLQDSYEDVMRHLTEGLSWQDQFRSSWIGLAPVSYCELVVRSMSSELFVCCDIRQSFWTHVDSGLFITKSSYNRTPQILLSASS